MTTMTPPRHARFTAARALVAGNLVFFGGPGLGAWLRLQHRHPQANDLRRILSGRRHEPVVYFIRIGPNVKIGTSANLLKRLRGLYLGPEDVLAVVPGDRRLEGHFHARFASSLVGTGGRDELFRMDVPLRMFLARWRCCWTEAMMISGCGAAVALITAKFYLGVLACIAGTLWCLLRPGWWEW